MSSPKNKSNIASKVEVRKQLSPKAERERSKKEVATKLGHLTALAKTEVVNDVLNKQVSRQIGGFADFLREQGVIGIGIGLVLGVQIKAVVDNIMNSLVNPITSLFLPGQQALSLKTITVHVHSRSAVIGWGAIVYSLFSFVMVATIVYILYKTLRLERLKKKV
ncbi:MAG TPA: MscL family protein [Patescibacteria group bacterium]|nr:MscL family protein [Patescibacteria group bacterium]